MASRGGVPQLEVVLLAEMQKAAQDYHQAVAEHQKVAEEFGALRGNPDGAFAIKAAAARERLMLEKYARAVRAYADLVVGKNER